MKLLYIMDPYCKWCYGTSDHIQQLYNTLEGKLPIEVIPAGMLAGEFTQVQSPANAFAIQRSNANIAKETGKPFGKGYIESLQAQEMVLDSEIPSRAIMACRMTAPQLTLQFAHQVLHARFFQGKDLNDTTTYLYICEEMDIDKASFFHHFSSNEAKENTQKAFLFAEKYAEHYPTLIYEENGEMEILTEGYSPYNILELRLSRLLKRNTCVSAAEINVQRPKI